MKDVRNLLNSVTGSQIGSNLVQLAPPNSPFLVDDNTQVSLDLNTHVVDFLATLRIGTSTPEKTSVHDQRDTSLCHSFAITSALRRILIQLMQKIQQQIQSTGSVMNLLMNRKKKCDDIIKKVVDSSDEYSFQRMLVAFCGNVNPRGIRRNLETQTAMLKTVMERLVNPTTFEIDGWKRMGPVQQMFSELRLNIEDYHLSYERVTHPNSATLETVFNHYRNGNSPFKPAARSFQVHR